MKEIADITIRFKNIEEVMCDVLIEFIEDQKIEYEVLKIQNQRTIDTRSEEEKQEDYLWDYADNRNDEIRIKE